MFVKLFRTLKSRIKARLPKQIVRVQVPVFVPMLNNNLLAGRTALITGGTQGIGLAMAKAFVASGAKVVITGRKQEKIDKAVAAIGLGGQGFLLDNQAVETFTSCIDKLSDRYGLPDILVNNAGVIICGKFGKTEVDNYDSIMDTNLKGAYFLSQEMANRWIAANIQGNILNICSSSSLRPGYSPYALSKWGMRAMTSGLAKLLIKHGIVVNGLAPGPTSTSMFVKDGSNGINYPMSPAGRLVTEEEVANLAVVLVSGLSRMVIGDVLYVTGGAGTITVDDVKL